MPVEDEVAALGRDVLGVDRGTGARLTVDGDGPDTRGARLVAVVAVLTPIRSLDEEAVICGPGLGATMLDIAREAAEEEAVLGRLISVTPVLEAGDLNAVATLEAAAAGRGSRAPAVCPLGVDAGRTSSSLPSARASSSFWLFRPPRAPSFALIRIEA